MISLLNTIASAWWHWMGPMFWQVSLLIGIITLIDMVIRKWVWPQLRYALWLLVLLKLVIPPGWTMPSGLITHAQPWARERIIGRWRRPPLDSSENTSLQTQKSDPEKPLPSIPAGEGATLDGLKPEGSGAVTSQEMVGRESAIWQVYMMGVWLLGTLLFLGLLTARIVKLRRWHQEQKKRKTIPVWFHTLLVQTAKRLKLNVLPSIVFSDQAVTPAVYGVFRPVLLLPANYPQVLSREEAEHMLLHELAHLKRGDLYMHGICLLLQIIYWFNPLLIWARKQMKHVREICCDLTIANLLRETTGQYRQTLLNTARALLTESVEPGMGLLGVFEEPFRLVSRLRWLEKNTWKNRRIMILGVILLSLTMGACLLPMARKNTTSSTKTVDSGQEGSRQIPTSGQDLRGEKNLPDLAVSIIWTEPLYAAVLPRIGDPVEFEQAVHRCRSILDSAGISPAGDPFFRIFSNTEKVTPDRISWEVGYPISRDVQVPPPLEIIQVAPQQMASTVLEGVQDSSPFWPGFIEIIKQRGYIPSFPPAWEIYHEISPDREFWWKTEMRIPVFHPEKGYPDLAITYKETRPFHALILPMRGSHNQYPKALEQLKSVVRENGIQTKGDYFGLYYSDAAVTQPSLYVWEVGVPVERGTEVDLPYQVREIEGGHMASSVVTGRCAWEYPWSAMILMLILEGNIPSAPAMEIWHENIRSPERSRTEMRIPVTPIKKMIEGETEEGDDAEAKKTDNVHTGDFSSHLKTTESFNALLLKFTGSGEELKARMREVQHLMQTRNIQPKGPAFILQHTSSGILPAYERIWEVGYRIDRKIDVDKPFEVRKIPSQRVYWERLGSMFDEDEANQRLANLFLEHNIFPKGSVFIFCPDRFFMPETGGKAWQIWIPLEEKTDPFPELAVNTVWPEKEVVLVLPQYDFPGRQQEALNKLQTYIHDNRIRTTGDFFFRYFSNMERAIPEEPCWEIGIPVEKGTVSTLPFEIKVIPDQLYVSSNATCEPEQIDWYWKTFALRSQIKGYFINGPPMRILREGALDGTTINEFRHPVRKKIRNPQHLPVFN